MRAERKLRREWDRRATAYNPIRRLASYLRETVTSTAERIRPKRMLPALALALLQSFVNAPAYALPTGEQNVSGTFSVNRAGQDMTVNQTSQTAIISWSGFNTASDESVTFAQPDNGVVLNRVRGVFPSTTQFDGTLSANGSVFIYNPNGIVFGSSSSVNVGALVATTRDISNSDFNNGDYKFKNGGLGSIKNYGEITAQDYALLFANSVKNYGAINVTEGLAGLTSGASLTLSQSGGDWTIGDTLSGGTLLISDVTNEGDITASGDVILKAASTALGTSTVKNTDMALIDAGGDVWIAGSAITLNGVINADNIEVDSSGDLSVGGSLNADGDIDIEVEDDIDISNAAVVASGSMNITSDDGEIEIDNSLLISGNDLLIATDDDDSGVSITNNSQIVADNDINIGYDDDDDVLYGGTATVIQDSLIFAGDDIYIGSSGEIEITDAILDAIDDVEIGADAAVVVDNSIVSSGWDLSIWGETVEVIDSELTAGEEVDIESDFDMSLSGSIAASVVDLDADNGSVNIGSDISADELYIAASEDIEQTDGYIEVDDYAELYAGDDITVTRTHNDFNEVAFDGDEVSIRDKDDLRIVELDGDASSAVNLEVVAGENLYVEDANVEGSARLVSEFGLDGIAIENSLDVGGDLQLIAEGGDITQANGSALYVGGNALLSAANGDINPNVDSATAFSTDFDGVVTIEAQNANILFEADDLVLGDVEVAHDMFVGANGDVTQALGDINDEDDDSTVAVGDALSVSTNGNIVLDNVGNHLNEVYLLGDSIRVLDSSDDGMTIGSAISAEDATLRSTGDIQIDGGIFVGVDLDNTEADLVVASLGDIVQAEDSEITVAGNALFAAGTSLSSDDFDVEGSVALDGTNVFDGTLSIGAGSARVNAADDVTLGYVYIEGEATKGSSGSGSSGNDGSLTLTVDGDVTQAAIVSSLPYPLEGLTPPSSSFITVSGHTQIDATGDVTLASEVTVGSDAVPANDFNTITVNAVNAHIADTNDIEVVDSMLSGDLVIRAVGEIEQSGALEVCNDLVMASLTGISQSDTASMTIGQDAAFISTNVLYPEGKVETQGDVNLLGANEFQGTLSVGAENAEIHTNSDVALAYVYIGRDEGDKIIAPSGSFTLVTTGNVSQSDAAPIFPEPLGSEIGDELPAPLIFVSGDADITATGTVTLDSTLNDFAGTLAVDALGTTVVDMNDLVLADVVVDGDLALTAGGDITQSSDGVCVSVTGYTDVEADDVTLTNTGNDFTGFRADADDVSVYDVDGIEVSGTDVNTFVVRSTGDVTITGLVEVADDLVVATLNGSISQDSSSTIDVDGDAAFIAGDALTPDGFNEVTGNVTLEGHNHFDGTLSVGAENASITDASTDESASGSVALGYVYVDGEFTLMADGDIVQAAPVGDFPDPLGAAVTGEFGSDPMVYVGGTAIIETGGLFDDNMSDIVLDSVANDFNNVNVNGANVVLFDGRDGMTVLDAWSAGDMTLMSTDDIAFEGTLFTGYGTFDVDSDLVVASMGNITGSEFSSLNVAGDAVFAAGTTLAPDDWDVNGEVELVGDNIFAGTLSVGASRAEVHASSSSFLGVDGVTLGYVYIDGAEKDAGGSGDLTLVVDGDVNQAALSSELPVPLDGFTAFPEPFIYVSGHTQIDATGNVDLSSEAEVGGVQVPVNDFSTLTVNAAGAHIADADEIAIVDSEIAGDFVVRAGGDIYQVGDLIVGEDLVMASLGGILQEELRGPGPGSVSSISVGGDAAFIAMNVLHPEGHVETNSYVELLGNNSFEGTLSVGAENAGINTVGDTVLGYVYIDDNESGGEFVLNTDGNVSQASVAPVFPEPLGDEVGDELPAPLVFIGGDADITASGDVTLANDLNDFDGVLSVEAASATITDIDDLTLGYVDIVGDLTLQAESIDQDSPDRGLKFAIDNPYVVVGGHTTATAGDGVFLWSDLNDFNTLEIHAGNRALVFDNGGLTLMNTEVVEGDDDDEDGDMSVLSTGDIVLQGDIDINDDFVAMAVGAGSITQDAASSLHVGDDALFATVDTLDYELEDDELPDFTGDVVLEGVNTFDNSLSVLAENACVNVDVADNDALVLGYVITDGDLGVTANGDIVQGNPGYFSDDIGNEFQDYMEWNGVYTYIGVGGHATIDAEGHDVYLEGSYYWYDNPWFPNDFNCLSIVADNAYIADIGGLVLGETSVSGDYFIDSIGDVTQNGSLNVGGNFGVDAYWLDWYDITLDDANNHFGSLWLDGYNVTLAEADSTEFEYLWAANADITSGGDVTQSDGGAKMSYDGWFIVEESASIRAEGDILLNNGFNSFGESGISLEGNNAELVATDVEADDIIFDEVSLTGNLSASTASSISQTSGGSVIVGGDATFDASTVDLSNETNDFVGRVNAYAGEVALRDANDLTLGVVETEELEVEATGDIAQAEGSSGSDKVADSEESYVDAETAEFKAGGDIILDSGDNALGLVEFEAGGDVLITDGDGEGIVLAASSAGGNITIVTDDIAIVEGDKIASLGGNISIQVFTDGTSVTVGDMPQTQPAGLGRIADLDPEGLNVSQDELMALDAQGYVEVGSTNSGDVTVVSEMDLGDTKLRLVTGENLHMQYAIGAGALELAGSDGENTFSVGGTSITGFGALSVDGRGGNDTLAVDDSGSAGQYAYNVDADSVDRTGGEADPVNIGHEHIETIELTTGTGDDRVDTDFITGVSQKLDGNEVNGRDELFVDAIGTLVYETASPLTSAHGNLGDIEYDNFSAFVVDNTLATVHRDATSSAQKAGIDSTGSPNITGGEVDVDEDESDEAEIVVESGGVVLPPTISVPIE